jgi:hypothetical protein
MALPSDNYKTGYRHGWRDALRLAADECEAQEVSHDIVSTLRKMAEQRPLPDRDEPAALPTTCSWCGRPRGSAACQRLHP